MPKSLCPSFCVVLALGTLVLGEVPLVSWALASPANETGPVLVLRTVPAGEPFFYSAAAIAELDSRGGHQVAASFGLTAPELERLQADVSGRVRGLEYRFSTTKSGEVEPCAKRRPAQFRERGFALRTGDEIANGQRLPILTLVHRAEHAVLGEVVEVVPGLFSGSPASVVRVKVLERLSRHPGALEAGTEFSYRSDFYDFELRGLRACGMNGDYFQPAPAKRAVFLLGQQNETMKTYPSLAEFELEHGELVLHPFDDVERGTDRVSFEQLLLELRR